MSIKSKLLTAVTTAGLLASLFGTALLPVAQAAASVVDADSLNVKSSDTDLIANIGGGVYHVKAGKTISIEGVFTVTDDDGVAASASVSGTTISGFTAGADVPLATIAPNAKSISFGFVDDSATNADGGLTANKFDVEFTVVGPAAGSTASVTLDDITIYLVGLSANVVGIPSSATSSMDASCEPNDSDGMGGGGAACQVTKTDYIDYDGGYIEYRLDLEDGYGSAVTSGYFTTATITGGAAGVVVTDDSSNCTEDEATSDNLIDDDGAVYICVATNGDESLPFTLTVTAGSLSYTRKIGVVGEIASLAVDGPSSLPNIDQQELQNMDALDVPSAFYDAFGVIAKDAAGNIIGNGGGVDAGYTATCGSDNGDGGHDCQVEDAYGRYGEWDSNLENGSYAHAGSDFEFKVMDKDGNTVLGAEGDSFDTDYSDDSPAADAQGNLYAWNDWDYAFDDEGYKTTLYMNYDADESYFLAQPDNLRFNVAPDLCGGQDAGTIRKVKVTDDLGLISSNTLTITCADQYAEITGATASATSVAQNNKVKFTFTATDGAGNLVGDGQMRSVGYATSWGTTGTLSLEFMGGTASGSVTVAPENSGSHSVILTVTDNQPATGSQTWTKSFNILTTNPSDVFTVNSLVKSVVVKARAVAVFSGAAGKKITFTVENARTGVVREYVRLANSAGKAFYTIAARGVYYVTATYGDRVTETIKLVK